MESKGGTWTYDDLNVYLYQPRDFVPGTKMSFAGIKDDRERANLIAYLRQETDNPPPLPAAAPTAAPAAAPAAGAVAPAEKQAAPGDKQPAPTGNPTQGAK